MNGPSYHGIRVSALDIRSLAAALGGTVTGRNSVLAPGPGHSPQDRSLTVTLDSSAPDGFVCFSHAGDDWKACRDYVRDRIGLPQWQPGDERDRRIDPSRLQAHDRAAMDEESDERTADDLKRVALAQALWNASQDPQGTAAERYLATRALVKICS